MFHIYTHPKYLVYKIQILKIRIHLRVWKIAWRFFEGV